MAEQDNNSGIRLTIPDGPPEKQLEAVNDFIEILKTFAKVTGEEDSLDLSQAYTAKEKLETQLNTQKDSHQ